MKKLIVKTLIERTRNAARELIRGTIKECRKDCLEILMHVVFQHHTKKCGWGLGQGWSHIEAGVGPSPS